MASVHACDRDSRSASSVSGFEFQFLTLNLILGTRHLKSLLIALLLALAHANLSSALEVPPLRGRVNDLAGLIPPNRVRALEERLASFEKETGHQIAVLTIPSLEGENREEFSIRVAETWKLGRTGFDNGVLLLIARIDRQLRIEVGYGLEGVLPDALASRIVREIIVPSFRANDFAGGIEAGIDAIMRATRGEVIPEQPRTRKGAPQAPEDYWAAVIGNSLYVLVFVLCISFFLGLFSGRLVPGIARSPMRQRLTGGAIGGGLAAGIANAPQLWGIMPDPWIWFLLMIGLGALVGAWAVRVLWKGLTGVRSTGAWSGSRYDRSSSWGGSSYSGGGSSSGGFSGGGGGFGGGGASGSW